MLQSEFPTDAQAVYDDIEKKVFTTIGCSKASFLAKHTIDGNHSSVLVSDDDGDDDRNGGGGSSTRSGSASRAAGIDSLIRQSLSLTSSSSSHNKNTMNKVTHASSTPIQTTSISSSGVSGGRDYDHWPMNGAQTASLSHTASRKMSFLDGAGERNDLHEQSNKRGSMHCTYDHSDVFFDDHQPPVSIPSPRLPSAADAMAARDTLLTNPLPTIASTVSRADTLATTRIPSQPSSSSPSAYSACSSRLGAANKTSALPSKADARERSGDSRDTDPWFSQLQPPSTAHVAFSHLHANCADSAAGVEKVFEYSVDLDDIFTTHSHDPRSRSTESIYQPHNRNPIAPTSTVIANPAPTNSLTRAHPYSQPLQPSLPAADTRKASFFTQQPQAVHLGVHSTHGAPHHPTSQNSNHHPSSHSFSQWEPAIYPTTTVPFAYDTNDCDDIFAPSQHVTRATPTQGQALLPQDKENFFDQSNVLIPLPHTSNTVTSMTDPSCTLSGYVRALPSTVTKRVIMRAAQEEEDW